MEEELLNKLETSFMGRNVIYYEQIPSTQIKAKEIKEELENGTIIITDNQTNGIGTHDRVWYMGESQNLAFTLVLKPNCNLDKIKNLTVLIAKCMVQAIENLYSIKLEIKEPNDLICRGKKIGGILTQSTTNNEKVKDILIGIGLNVCKINFPEDLKNIATSLKNEFDYEFEKTSIMAEFLNVFEVEYCKILS